MPSGRCWLRRTQATDHPLVLGLGTSGDITITITPTSATGTTIAGAIHIDTYNNDVHIGGEVAALPYHYTIS